MGVANPFYRMSFAVLTAATVAVSTVHAAEYVPGEVLIVPDEGFSASALSAMGMFVEKEKRGESRYARVKLKADKGVEAAVAELSSTPGVKYAQPNYIYHATALPNDPDFSELWGLQNTGQTVDATAGTSGADISVASAWDTVTDCSTVTVAVIDSGVDYLHEDLSGEIWTNTAETAANVTDDDTNGYVDDTMGWDFVQDDNDPMDYQYHGTHVAGTIGASGNNATGGTGVCWNATIMPLRVLNSTGAGTTANIVAAIDYAVANGADIINMSLGGTSGSDGDLMDLAIADADSAGVLVIAAAGNSADDNDATPHYPASYEQPNIIAVAATDQNDELASYSNFGATSVDVAAPGSNIYSTYTPDRVTVGCDWNFDTGTMEGWTGATYDTSGASPSSVANTVAVTSSEYSSASYSLTDTPGTDYDDDRLYTAVSPACDLSGEEGGVLDFAAYYTTEPPFPAVYDYIDIQGSNDASSWSTLMGGAAGTNGGWDDYSLDLTDYDGEATTYFLVFLQTDGSYSNYDGFYIDDVSVTVPGTVRDGTQYAHLNGTSMATPHVSGLAALIWAAEPGLTHTEVRSRVIDNGDPLASLSGKTVSGKRINAQLAMALTAPSGLSASAASSSRVDLSWVDNTDSEDAYRVQRDAGGGFSTVATLSADSESYSDTSAPDDTTLTYRVLAVARDGRTAASGIDTATTPEATATTSSDGGGGGGGAVVWLLPLLLSVFGRRRLR